MDPTWLDRLDEAFENKLRLGIVSALISVESMDFGMMKKVTGGTDGNISIQSRKLEDMGYITAVKSFVDRKPKTTYTLTKQGREAFHAYVRLLEAVLKGK